MTKNQKVVLIVAGAGGAIWWFSSSASAATRAKLGLAPLPKPKTPAFPSATGQRSSSSPSLGEQLAKLFGGGGGGGSFGGSGSGFSAPPGPAVNPAGDRRTGPGSTGYVPGPGAPGYISPNGEIAVGIGSNYGPGGIFVDYAAQSAALGVQLDAASNTPGIAGRSEGGDVQGFIADALNNPPADYIDAGGDNLASHPLFYTPEDAISVPIGNAGDLAPDLGSGDTFGFLADARGGETSGTAYGIDAGGNLYALPVETDAGLSDPGAAPIWWGGSSGDGSGFAGPVDLGAVDPNQFLAGDQVYAGGSPTFDESAPYDYSGDYYAGATINAPDYNLDPSLWVQQGNASFFEMYTGGDEA